MRLISIDGNRQRLDGGAMFGNCPRALWSRWIEPDDEHRVPLGCRSLLVELDDGRRVIFEAGIGAFFNPAMRARYGVERPGHGLQEGLAELGLTDADIDVVVLSHLHFDHAGGLLSAWRDDTPHSLLFPRAQYVVGARQWERATSPHYRDRKSYLPELNALLETSGRLELVDGERSPALGDLVTYTESHGHTPGLLVARIETPVGPLYSLADLAPGVAWLHLPITMGYDRAPEQLVDEKRALLARIADEEGWAFFTHDPFVAAARVVRNERRSYGAGETLDVMDYWAVSSN